MNLRREFDDIKVQHVPRAYNEKANNLAQIGSGTRIDTDVSKKMVCIQKMVLPLARLCEMALEDFSINIEDDDWREPVSQCLLNPRKERHKMKLNWSMMSFGWVIVQEDHKR